MIIKQGYRDADSGSLRTRTLEAWECRCDEPDWCGCGRCHRCGEWLRRKYDPKVCAITVSKKSRFRRVANLQFGDEDKAIRGIDNLLRKYAGQVQKSGLSLTSKSIYIDNASYFVRWIHGEFQPGSRGAWNRPKYPKDAKRG
jgi:hypothetical protein